MNERNAVTKEYMKRNDRFADVCNYFLFHGKQVIHAEDLTERDITELAVPFKDNKIEGIEKLRDILKNCVVKTANGVTYLLIGIENQSEIHYAMPVRNMLYDAIRYAEQVNALAEKNRREKNLQPGAEYLSGISKSDKLHAVVTITIYWNTGSWDGARSLHELLDVKDSQILKYVPDYPLNLIVPDEITNFESFQTEFGRLMEFFQCAESKEALDTLLQREQKNGFTISRDAVQLINTCLNAKITLPDKKEDTKMCKAIDDMIADGEARGEARGLSALVSSLKKFISDTEELYQTVISNEVYKDTTKEEVLKYLN